MAAEKKAKQNVCNSTYTRKNLTSTTSRESSMDIEHLLKLIGNILTQQPLVTLDEIGNSSDSNSTLGKLYRSFLCLKTNANHSLDEDMSNDVILKKIQESISKFQMKNKYSMDFIDFIKQIDLTAKESHLTKEHVYEQLRDQRGSICKRNENNNALDSAHNTYFSLLEEYNNDMSNLENYFIKHCEKTTDGFHHGLTCSHFIEWITRNTKLNKIDVRLQLNGLFSQIQSSLTHQGVYLPGSTTIDFCGFMLCLQKVSLNYKINLRSLIKSLVKPKVA